MKKILFAKRLSSLAACTWVCSSLYTAADADVLFMTNNLAPGVVYAYNTATGNLLNPQPYITLPLSGTTSEFANGVITVNTGQDVRLFVTNDVGANTPFVYGFNALTGAPLGPQPFAMIVAGGTPMTDELAAFGNTVLVSDSLASGHVYSFNALTGGAAELFAHVPGVAHAFSLAVSSTDGFVSNAASNPGRVLDFPIHVTPLPVTATIFATLTTGKTASQIETYYTSPYSSYPNDVLFVATDAANGNLYAFDTVTGAPIPAANVPFLTATGNFVVENTAFTKTTGYVDTGGLGGSIQTFNPNQVGSPLTFFANYPADSQGGALWVLETTIDTKGIGQQAQSVANAMNAFTNFLLDSGTPYPLANLEPILNLAPLSGKALENALQYRSPAANAFPIFAAANAQFAASDVVEDHQRMKRFLRHTRRRLREQEHHKPTGYHELISDATQELLLATPSVEASATPNETSQQDSSSSTLPEPKTQMATEPAPVYKKIYSPWVELFGAYARQQAQKESPSFKDSLGGIVLGWDLFNYKTTLFGAGVGYTYSYVHKGGGAGHSVVNQEYAVVYGTFEFRKFYVDPAVWGSLMQISNVRHIPNPGVANAKSNPKGWMLSPHLEIGYDIDRDWLTVEPFAMFDWPNVWEDSFQEHGAGVLSVKQSQHHSSLLRSELGFRFYQAIRTRYARCVIQEKASYVNKKPFKMGSVTAFFSGAPGSFTVETLSGDQSLGCAEIEFLYDPDNKSHPYISVSYQGETTFTGAYYSHLAMISMGKEF
jgi:outer membrane autotransporter protein